jgi:hypothetical protein
MPREAIHVSYLVFEEIVIKQRLEHGLTYMRVPEVSADFYGRQLVHQIPELSPTLPFLRIRARDVPDHGGAIDQSKRDATVLA